MINNASTSSKQVSSQKPSCFTEGSRDSFWLQALTKTGWLVSGHPGVLVEDKQKERENLSHKFYRAEYVENSTFRYVKYYSLQKA